MKREVIAATSLLMVLGFLLECSYNGEVGFKSSNQKLMQELRVALKEAAIAYREDEEGFITYQKKDEAAVERIIKRADQELSGGVAVKYEDTETTQYLRDLLTSMGMKYRVEKRADGEWTRWYPQSEAQGREVHRKVVEHSFELKKQKLSTKCKEASLASRKSADKHVAEKTPPTC